MMAVGFDFDLGWAYDGPQCRHATTKQPPKLHLLAGIGMTEDGFDFEIKFTAARGAVTIVGSAFQGAWINRHLTQLETYGAAGLRTLENGRMWYFGALRMGVVCGVVSAPSAIDSGGVMPTPVHWIAADFWRSSFVRGSVGLILAQSFDAS